MYRTAFGRAADPEGLTNRIRQLQSGISFEALAEELVASAEFETRHGSTQKVDTDFLNALCHDSLGRKPDPDGLANWLAEAEDGATRPKVLAVIAGSDEALKAIATLLVNSLCQTAFGRAADEVGLANCVEQLRSRVSLEALAEGLAGSAEFQARHGPSQGVDGEYLTALYRDGLGSEPEPEGLAHWLAEGKRGVTRAEVLAAFAGSSEALQKRSANLTASLLVNALYKGAFGRIADQVGLANRIQQLQSGVSIQALAEEFVGSAEFQARHGSGKKVDVEFFEALYRDALGREADPEGLAHWLAEGEKGATRATVLAAFAGSDEAIENVANLYVRSLYRTAFGRNPDAVGLANCIKQLQSGSSLEALAEG